MRRVFAANLMLTMVGHAYAGRCQALASIVTALIVHLVEQHSSIAIYSEGSALDKRQIEIANKLMVHHLGETPNMSKHRGQVTAGICGVFAKI